MKAGIESLSLWDTSEIRAIEPEMHEFELGRGGHVYLTIMLRYGVYDVCYISLLTCQCACESGSQGGELDIGEGVLYDVAVYSEEHAT